MTALGRIVSQVSRADPVVTPRAGAMRHTMMSRRIFVTALLTAVAGSGAVASEPYPNRAARIVVPYSAGGAVDTIARILANGLQQRLGQPFIVENKPGASANLGADTVAKSPPDGYTLLVTANAIATNMSLFAKLPFDTMRDLRPVLRIGQAPLVIVSPPSLPARTLQELIALAKAKPDELTYASTGNGSSNHLAAELFKTVTGAQLRHVAYRGGAPALTDLLGERISTMFINPTEALPYLEAKQLRAIAVTDSKRLPMLPDVPTTAEAGVQGVEATVWWGMLAPAQTPDAIVQALNEAARQALTEADTLKRLAGLGITPSPGTAEEFKSFLAQEIDRWREVIKAANIRVE